MNNILIALAVVSGIALIAGVLLALLSHFFGVEKSKELKAISACLPGVNCGACGYKGCDDYATALANGEAAPNKCVPGGANTAAVLGELLGIEVEKPKELVAFVHCNGNCEATVKKASYEGLSSCRAAALVHGGPKSCKNGCLGFGECAAACPAHAICMMDGIAHVDTSRCIGCGICKSVCPKNLISMIPHTSHTAVVCSNTEKGADARKVCKNACIGCKKCERLCTEVAITVVNNYAKIDYDKCTGCGTCVEACPTGCLKKVIAHSDAVRID